MANKSNVYNFTLFKRLLSYVKSYKSIFILSIVSVFGLSIFGALRPVVLEKIVDENLTASNYEFFLEYIILMFSLLVLEVTSNYSFIFNRLSIVDLTANASQPMFSDQFNTSIMFNGEIYNHKTLRESLENENIQFKSKNSDTEVLLNGLSKNLFSCGVKL